MENDVISMEIINPHAAGIDVGSRSHWVAVGQSEQDVREYGVFNEDLFAMADWLEEQQVKTIAMENTTKGDIHSLMIAMEENTKNHPELALNILRVLEDGDLVAVHSHVKMTTDDLGVALIHIFRFENHKIVELWDFGQAVPKDMVNENGMF